MSVCVDSVHRLGGSVGVQPAGPLCQRRPAEAARHAASPGRQEGDQVRHVRDTSCLNWRICKRTVTAERRVILLKLTVE